MPKRVKAVILDFDGTLVNSYEPLHRGMVKGMEKHSRLDREKFKKWKGGFTLEKFWKKMNWHSYIEEAHTSAGIRLGKQKLKHITVEVEREQDSVVHGARFYKDVRSALEGFHRQGLTVAICSYSTKGRIKQRLKEEGLLNFVDENLIYSRAHSRNRAERLGELLKKLSDHGITPQECVMIGDMPTDVEAGNARGVKTIIVRRKVQGKYIIPKDSFAEAMPHKFFSSEKPLVEASKEIQRL